MTVTDSSFPLKLELTFRLKYNYMKKPFRQGKICLWLHQSTHYLLIKKKGN